MRGGGDVARGFHLYLADEQLGRRRMSDGDEHAVDGLVFDCAGLHVLQAHPVDLHRIVAAEHVLEHGVPDHFDLRMLEQPVLQDLFGAEVVAPVHYRDLAGKIGEEEGFLDRGVAAADHHHFLVAVEEPIAGRAGGHAVALELLLGRQIEPARLRAGGDDQCVGEIDVARIAGQPERPARQLRLVDVIGDDLRPHMLGLLLHLLHQPRALDHIGEARIVLDVGGDRELAAWLDALDQHGLQHGARGVDRGRVAGRTRSDNDHLRMRRPGHCACPHRTPGLRLVGPIRKVATRRSDL